MANSIDEIRDEMTELGIEVPEGYQLVADSKAHRFHPANESGCEKNAWYLIYKNTSKSGTTYYSGSFGLKGDTYTISKGESQASSRPPSTSAPTNPAPASSVPNSSETKAEHDDPAVIKAAQKIWDAAHPATEHNDYAARKRIHPYGAREHDGDLIVPVFDFETPLAGLQTVYKRRPGSDQQKMFLRGQRMSGRFFSYGLEQDSERIYVTEGYATGCTIHEATNEPIVVAFSALNFFSVCTALEKRYPDAEIIICADDDRFFREKALAYVREKIGIKDFSPQVGTTQCKHGEETIRHIEGEFSVVVDRIKSNGKTLSKRFENTGRLQALKVERHFHCLIAVPQFTSSPTGTDFNDLACDEGIEIVRKQLKELTSTKSKKAVVSKLAERFIYVFPDGMIYDREQNLFAKENAFITMFLNDDKRLKREWIKQRRRIERKDLVFNPNEETLPGQINTFQGWGLEPASGKCNLILAHLKNILCNGDEELFSWVLRWLAYPLQHPGEKMDTALVFYGAEGTGKSLFFEHVMKPIYGQYALSISPAELRCAFNEWISHKLFLVCEEVISDQDAKFQKSILKNYITAKKFTIQQKHMDTRTETARANFVFLSNEIQPLRLDSTDRRYMVIRVDKVESKEYFQELAEEIENGGAAAFFDYLKRIDLGNFKKSMPVLETEGHKALKELGKSSPVRFFENWIAGECFDLPIGPVASQDLYAAYVEWCKRVGEQRPMAKNYCLALIEQIKGVSKNRLALEHRSRSGDSVLQQVTIIYPTPECLQLERSEIGRQVNAFHIQVDTFCA